MTLSEELKWRGFYKQSTFPNLKWLDDTQVTFYHGFDATADSQTIGNLAGLMFNKVLIRHGHKCLVLVGGATSLIGDPGGKRFERPLTDEQTIAHNVDQTIEELKQIHREDAVTFVNNLDWTKNLSAISFLRDIGKHFAMNQLVHREYIASRLSDHGTGISYTEFSYGLLQAMDFLHLYDNNGVTLQLGTSDQWSNCLLGAELIRKLRNTTVHVLTHPLIVNKSTGRKFGRSEPNPVWLDAKKTSIFKFYQFWINRADTEAEDFLKIYTTLDKPAIDQIMEHARSRPKLRLAQKTLAYETTRIVHGQDNADEVARISQLLFETSDMNELRVADLQSLSRQLPVIERSAGRKLIDLLVATGLTTSKSDARRLINQHGVYLNRKRVELSTEIDARDFTRGFIVLQRGKKTFAVVV